MQVIGYTHSGHSLSVFYGFASLFLIGFLWASLGGAGTTLPAILSEEELKSSSPILLIFSAWLFQDFLVEHSSTRTPLFASEIPSTGKTPIGSVSPSHSSRLYLRPGSPKFDSATSLIIYMALGWWAGFLLLVVVLGWRMTPPRGDNWAGCLGWSSQPSFFLNEKNGALLTVRSSLRRVWRHCLCRRLTFSKSRSAIQIWLDLTKSAQLLE